MATTIQDQIRQTALSYGVDPAIALAVAQQESGFNQAARGAAGEVGVFQLMPATASGLGVNPYSTSENIQGGVSYLAQLYRQFGDWTKALAAYNGGPTAMAQGKTPSVSWTYAQEVLETSADYGGVVDDSGDASTSYAEAGILGDVGEIPNWVWLALVVGAGALVVISSRD
jgi:soluble lytic murein transglycosylase-like protein